MITYTRSTSEEELNQILRLQQCNLPNSVSEAAQNTEGFVTVQHDLQLLKAMQDTCPHILAKDGNTVVGYALSMHPDFGDSIAVLKPMFAEINSVKHSASTALRLTLERFIVMGQICIDKSYRKQGIFRNLYKTMRDHLLPPFLAIITEVDAKNDRSLKAHYAVGFEDLARYTAGGQEWVLICLK
jgi:hypothetical protein